MYKYLMNKRWVKIEIKLWVENREYKKIIFIDLFFQFIFVSNLFYSVLLS